MISTDGVKEAADDLNVLDSQAIANQLSELQSQKFVDPNCHPEGKEIIDVGDDSFCASPPLKPQERTARLNAFLEGLPTLDPLPDQTACSEKALTDLQNLIDTKFNFSTLPDQIMENNFLEEKIEAQLTIVSFITVYAYALTQVNRKLPNLVAATKTNIETTITAIETLKITDQIASFEQQYAVNRLRALLDLIVNSKEDKTSFDVRLSPMASFVNAQEAAIKTFTVEKVIKKYNDYIKYLDDKITWDERKPPSKGFGAVYKNAGTKLQKAENPQIDDYTTDVIEGKNTLLNTSYASMLNLANKGIIKQFAFFTKSSPDIQSSGYAKTVDKFLTEAYKDLTTFFVNYVTGIPKPPTEAEVLEEISKLDFCGVKLPGTIPEDTEPDVAADLSWNTFDANNRPTITEVKYWQKYSIYLTLVNLLPTYWTIGLYIPTSSGILKIKLPTLWRPIAVIDAKAFGLIVIFITINGIAISPTIWQMRFPPVPPVPPIKLPTFPTAPALPTTLETPGGLALSPPVLPVIKGPFGIDGFNKDGFDVTGFDRTGYNMFGFDRKGFNKAGFDVHGFNADGFDVTGYNTAGYNVAGFNKEGFNVQGFNAAGLTRDGKPISAFVKVPTPANPLLGIPAGVSLNPKLPAPSLSGGSGSSGPSSNPSGLFVMLRAKNKKIKDSTGNQILNPPIVNGIDTNPKLTKSLPFVQDDLPVIKRMSLANLPYVAYLNAWLKQYKTGGGLP